MKQIEKIGLIDKKELSGEYYLASLLEAAAAHGLLDEAAVQRIQLDCLELLAQKTEAYTGGDSSSVRVEVAESLMQSNLYTISLYLKTFPCPDDAVRVLQEKPATELYRLGRKAIETKRKTTKLYHAAVLASMPDIDLRVYQETLTSGIYGFFKLYDPDFGAHEIHITADYPLCNPVEGLAGIEFIQKYLESVKYENEFCGHFLDDTLNRLLCGYDENYQDLILNLFAQVLTSALGCVLTGNNAAALDIPPAQVLQLQEKLTGRSKDELEALVRVACEKLLQELPPLGTMTQKYLEKALPEICASLSHAVKIGHLSSLLVPLRQPDSAPHLYVSHDAKMDDEQYRGIVADVMESDSPQDKISMILHNIHLLADLEDLIFDADLDATELSLLFTQLEPAKLAALSKRHPFKTGIDAMDFDEAETALRLCLHNHILSLPPEQQNWIANTARLLVYDDM